LGARYWAGSSRSASNPDEGLLSMFKKMISNGPSASTIIKSNNISVASVDEIGDIISQTLLKFPKVVERFKGDDVKLKGFFI